MCTLDMVQYIYMDKVLGIKHTNFQNISNLTLHQFGRMAHILYSLSLTHTTTQSTTNHTHTHTHTHTPTHTHTQIYLYILYSLSQKDTTREFLKGKFFINTLNHQQ